MADHLIATVNVVIEKLKLVLELSLIYYCLICLHCWTVFTRSRLCELDTVRQRLWIIIFLTVVSGLVKSFLYPKLLKVWGEIWSFEDTAEVRPNHSYSCLLSIFIGILVPELQNLRQLVGDVLDKDVSAVLGDVISSGG